MSNTNKNPKIDKYGTKGWYDENGSLHREDGPAIVGVSGSKYWYRHGKKHREDGPAVTHSDGYEAWWRHGERYKPTETELAKWELKRAMEAYEKQL